MHEVWKAETKPQRYSFLLGRWCRVPGAGAARSRWWMLLCWLCFVSQWLSHSSFGSHRISSFSNSSSWPGARLALWRRARRMEAWRCWETSQVPAHPCSSPLILPSLTSHHIIPNCLRCWLQDGAQDTGATASHHLVTSCHGAVRLSP